jgi:hypothetical protein
MNIKRIYEEKFMVKNISGGRIVSNLLSLPHGDSTTINPIGANQDTLKAIEILYSHGKAEISFDIVEDKPKENSNLSVKQVDSENGEHTIFNGLIEVNETQAGKSVEVEKSFTEESIKKDFLEQHWKKIEAQLQEIDNVDVVEGYLELATELGIAGKKLDLLKQRIKELS